MEKDSSKIKIALVEDHEVVRNALAKMLAEVPNFDFVFEAEHGQDFLDQLKTKPIDVVLLDLEMPVLDGIETLKALKKQASTVKVIMLSMHNDLDIIFELLSMGAGAYLLKNCSTKETIEAITMLHTDGKYSNFIMNEAVINTLASERKTQNGMKHLELSARDMKVLSLICDGFTSNFIADAISTSKKNVDFIRSQIMKKMNVKTSNELMRMSILHGLYTPRSNKEIELEKENVLLARRIKRTEGLKSKL